MPQCSRCGKKGFFLKLTNGLCPDCISSKEVDPPIKESDKKYYRPDDYYTDTVPVLSVDSNGNYGRRKVVTFEERKAISYPSRNGLYVAEILLLHYCSYGTYPHPQNGYPGFWWFEYGIRNVDARLENLRIRGFIEFSGAEGSLKYLTVMQLKEVANSFGICVSGKKSDIISKIVSTVPRQSLERIIGDGKYKLTTKGITELKEYAYIPYMHKSPQKTIEGSPFGYEFNVWTINKKIGNGSPENWEQIIADELSKAEAERITRNEKSRIDMDNSLRYYSQANPELYKEFKELDDRIKSQDTQLKSIQATEKRYEETGDIDSLIAFWESIWAHGGLLFNGSRWTFRLPDIYIKQKRYDDAIRILGKIKNPLYQDKVNSYITKVTNLKEKSDKTIR